MNDGGDCGTSPAKLGLLNIVEEKNYVSLFNTSIFFNYNLPLCMYATHNIIAYLLVESAFIII